jgi:hypothetical protein
MTTCESCGFQVVFRQAAGTASLADTVQLKITPTLIIDLIKAGTSLPTTLTETIATSKDSQTELNVEIIVGSETIVVVYPLAKSPPRGMPAAQMKLTIAATGEMDLELREEGTTNVRHYPGRARVR